MTNSELFYQTYIKTPLSTATGYSYVDGWVRVHLDELKKNSKNHRVNVNKAPTFPIFASHCLEDVYLSWSLTKFSIRRTVVVSGAIDVGDKLTIDTRLQKLYRDAIKQILSSIARSPEYIKDAPKMALNNAKFSIPDDELPYAMFELTITITTQEDISQWLS